MSRAIASPEPCFRQVKKVQGGVYVPCRIHRTCHCTITGGDDNLAHPWRETCDRYPQLEGEIDGHRTGVDWLWNSGEEITEPEYQYRIDLFRHARHHEPGSPEANPHKVVDFATLPPPTFD